MKLLLKTSLGAVVFYYLVFPFAYASLLTFWVTRFKFLPQDEISVYSLATEYQPCETLYLDNLGNLYVNTGNPWMALHYYGKAMECSPSTSVYRMKFGLMLWNMGFEDGIHYIEQAIRVEPNNPHYNQEYKKIMGPRLRSQ